MNLKGIEFRAEPNPRFVNSRSGICLVLGSSPSIHEDLFEAVEVLRNEDGTPMPYDVMACNLSFLAWKGKLDHLVSLHQEKLAHFNALAYTIPVDRPAHIMTHASMACDQAEASWEMCDLNGTSSLFCIKIAHMLGYSKIILCGVSLEGNHRFYDNHNFALNNNMGCSAIEYSWHEYKWLPYRAFSGKPFQINGFPTKEWLNG